MIVRPALIQQRGDLRGANESVLAESVNCVRPVRHGAVLVTEADVRMMIGSMGDPRHGIDEGRGLPIVVALERRFNRFAIAVPLPAAIELKQGERRVGKECVRTGHSRGLTVAVKKTKKTM